MKKIFGVLVFMLSFTALNASPIHEEISFPRSLNDKLFENLANEFLDEHTEYLEALEWDGIDAMDVIFLTLSAGTFYSDVVTKEIESVDVEKKQFLGKVSKKGVESLNRTLEASKDGLAFRDLFGNVVQVNFDHSAGRLRSFATANWNFIVSSNFEIVRAVRITMNGKVEVYSVNLIYDEVAEGGE